MISMTMKKSGLERSALSAETASPRTNVISKQLREAKIYEKKLAELVSNQSPRIEVEHVREKLRDACESIIISNAKYCAQNDVIELLWKSVYYQFIESLRLALEKKKDEPARKALTEFLVEGISYFTKLIERIDAKLDIHLEKFLNNAYSDLVKPDNIKVWSICVQKILIYLGDLERYHDLVREIPHSSKALSYYNKAQSLGPKNAKVYSKLAGIASKNNRVLDQVYYYTRCLSVPAPYKPARDSLITVYDEIRKKYEHLQRANVSKSSKSLVGQTRNESRSMENQRLEIWIRPDGTKSKQTSKIESESPAIDMTELSDLDLNKQFILSYLHVHGKLFSKVGMENFDSVAKRMLIEFRTLLNRPSMPYITWEKLSQLMAINMYSVMHTSSTGEEDRCSYLREKALHVNLALVSLILKKVISLLRDDQLKEADKLDSQLINCNYSQLLPVVKIWTDWMSSHSQLWSPPRAIFDFDIGEEDIWQSWAQMLTLLNDVNMADVELMGSKVNDACLPVILPEENMMAGFSPLLKDYQVQNWYLPPCDKEKVKNCYRIRCIQEFGRTLCDLQPEPLLEYDVMRKCFKSLSIIADEGDSDGEEEEVVCIEEAEEERKTVASEIGRKERADNFDSDDEEKKRSKEPFKGIPQDNLVSRHCEPCTETLATQAQPSAACLLLSPTQLKQEESKEGHLEAKRKGTQSDDELKKLCLRKEELQRVMLIQQKFQDQVNALLDSGMSRQPLVVRPRLLVPDTNCLVDHVALLQVILDSGIYQLAVPLIVINELRSLKGRGDEGKPDSHESHVARAADEALLWLETKFAEKGNKIKAITSMGSVLDTMNFTHESPVHGTFTNDDLVLSSCSHLEKQQHNKQDQSRKADSATPREKSVVLLTEDRNLRVKASSQELPVKSLPVFYRWAQVDTKSKRDTNMLMTKRTTMTKKMEKMKKGGQ
ncbi:Telomerase-binding protein EST1A [Halotydeus destructor]|nr:Telomerase-binding protein EST1A [Halotydeus destructor]